MSMRVVNPTNREIYKQINKQIYIYIYIYIDEWMDVYVMNPASFAKHLAI